VGAVTLAGRGRWVTAQVVRVQAGLVLAVFVPQTGWALPRTAAEPNFPAGRFGTACLLLLLGLLTVAAGIVPVIRGH
jgi:hypothetical protein